VTRATNPGFRVESAVETYGLTVVSNTSVRLAGWPSFTWTKTGTNVSPMLASPSFEDHDSAP